MKLFNPGDSSKAICAHCGVVKEILVAICDICSAVVAIPAQSTPAIRRARESTKIKKD